ncbi:hypothetical protein FS837_001326 [Tulasnella sp. UAMH 9824]|nr:hypothetical protein FS837_001326 [Tulasnella sp. UAMH 9824]
MDSNNLSDDIDLVFNGTDGEEAEAARREGKIRDNEWIVDLVSTCMRGQALRWYIELDDDTQSDWKLLRKAILRQYPSGTQPPAPSVQSMIPTPAAAATPPNPVSPKQSSRTQNKIYRIRLYFGNRKSQFYLSTNADSSVRMTNSGAKALSVRWNPENGLRVIENVKDQ